MMLYYTKYFSVARSFACLSPRELEVLAFEINSYGLKQAW